jgi:uncharacterized protein YkwD
MTSVSAAFFPRLPAPREGPAPLSSPLQGVPIPNDVSIMAPRAIAADRTVRIRRHLALLLTALLVTAPVFARPAEALTDHEASFGEMANHVRENHGIRSLRVTERLSALARKHSKQMANRGELYHSNLRRVFRGFNYRVVGENVGYGGSLDQLVDAFMDSPAHAENILGQWRKTGVGVFWQGDRVWVTQLFYR